MVNGQTSKKIIIDFDTDFILIFKNILLIDNKNKSYP